jgi:hypothetical protein
MANEVSYFVRKDVGARRLEFTKKVGDLQLATDFALKSQMAT